LPQGKQKPPTDFNDSIGGKFDELKYVANYHQLLKEFF